MLRCGWPEIQAMAQPVGIQFADIASLVGNIICTLPDYPSEIRARAGTLAGVSGYQLNFGDQEITTPGDSPFVLVAMNPVALKVNLCELQPGGIIVVNEDEFTPAGLKKAEYQSNPLEDGSLQGYRVIPVAITRLNEEAVRPTGLPRQHWDRCKNFFALGVLMWLYDRPLQPLLEWLIKKFQRTPDVLAANAASLRAGYNYANTAELFPVHYQVAEAKLPKGRYRRVTGNEAIALGCVVAAQLAGRCLAYASYPITPASEILHELSRHKQFNVRTIQCEDEIAACCAAIGASFAGSIGMTGTSGPGLALKSEGIGLAVMTGASAGRLRRAAGRAQHRHAHEDGTVRSSHGHVRPARRVPRRGPRGRYPGGLLRDGVRGGSPGHEVHDARLALERQLPGQLRGADAIPAADSFPESTPSAHLPAISRPTADVR